jgi:hypothetical protein
MQQISRGPQEASTGRDTKKYVSMRKQPLWLYRSACLLLALSGAMMIFERVNATAYYDTLKLLLGPERVEWVPVKDAAARAIALKKPILLVNMVRNNYYSDRAEWSVIRDGHNADIINQHYVPVRVDGDALNNASLLSPIINELPFTNNYNKGFGMLAIPYKLIGANYRDVMSTDNIFEICNLPNDQVNGDYDFYSSGCAADLSPVSKSFHAFNWSGRVMRRAKFFPALYWFETSGDVSIFLDRAYKWHTGKPYRGTVHWQPETSLTMEASKPKLLTFVPDCGVESDQLRNQLFKDEGATLVNQKFLPVLFDVKRENEELKINRIEERARGDYLDLRKTYKVKQLPAMVIVWPSGQSRVVYCDRGIYNIKEDLSEALQAGPLWESAPEGDTVVKCSHDGLCRIKGHNHFSR